MTLVIEEDTTQIQFVLFDEKGEIHQTGHLPRYSLRQQEREGRMAIEGAANHRLDYVLDGVITKRPESPATIAGSRISNLVYPCVIEINGTRYECDESFCDLEFVHVGEYNIKVIKFPFLDKEFKVAK